MPSNIFGVDKNETFYLKNRICIEGISEEALKSYCSDLLFCGTCFRSLTRICDTYSPHNGKISGYIFQVCGFVLFQNILKKEINNRHITLI